ncbi:MAG: NAD(P)/FAD-dependent oxidoreductase [Gammaproteobacteria bacterium]
MNIAIIGSGISGLVAAHQLHTEHAITLFEANDYLGGHTHTVEVETDGRRYGIDTGFIVFNDWTYPHFVALLETLGVASQPSTMSFSVHCQRSGLEYNGTSLNALFAQRRNLFRPAFYRMIRDILRFNREALALLSEANASITLGEYLERHHYCAEFIHHYLVPMGAAIWSTDPTRLWAFPAAYLVRFFHNHGMLSVDQRPQWRVITGGSASYVERLTAPWRDRIRLNCPVRRVLRSPHRVQLQLANGEQCTFDYVVMACHSDQALRLLVEPSGDEQAILGAIAYQSNEVILHTDESLLPRHRRAWAAWNYHIPAEPGQRVAVTYNMNILQGIDAPRQFCVTLNRGEDIDPDHIIRRFVYEHPVYTEAAVAAQRHYGRINGPQRTFYCGAYWGYGFHEDGVKSALRMCRYLNYQLRNEKLHLRRAS